MQNSPVQSDSSFHIALDANGIIRVTPKESDASIVSDPVLWLEKLATLLITLLDPVKKVRGIIYQSTGSTEPANYSNLFQAATHSHFYARLQTLAEWVPVIKQAKIPIVSIISGKQNSQTLAPALWGHYIIAAEQTLIQFPEATLGMLPAMGATVPSILRLSLPVCFELLIKGKSFNSQQALEAHLIDLVTSENEQLVQKAVEWITDHPTHLYLPHAIKDETAEAAPEKLKQKANLKFPGIYSCFELMKAAGQLPVEGAMLLEAEHYNKVFHNGHALALVRTFYYGIRNATTPRDNAPGMNLQKIGIIGAGIMGSGIAFEMARAGLRTALKDSSLELAEKGKQYTAKCCDKLIAMGKMTQAKKETMLSLITPASDYTQLQDADIIIEAVFEQQSLKAAIIRESEGFLRPDGIFASNTTSLPITALAQNSRHPERFIGLHFFSPVDRMPLVEIISGRGTSEATLAAAEALVLKLGKTPISVHDGPAFFTSRIFFNYLLEAVTMLLEGIDAEAIETSAIRAGFAVSPLSVLDEISLPLLLHVYDQLPELTASQKRCYDYIQKLTAKEHLGRKAGKGFYLYDTATGKKILAPDIQHNNSLLVPSSHIQTRLLHVMALDSYRCLASNILSKPIDGDLGSILGVGYAAHTGGVFSHMDQVGLENFIQDCDAFKDKGEQWEVPDALRKLASQQYSFYKGFDSNWPSV